tara:strand:- start:139 stop:603 length:465 start_codon:yes stop_codon:yes gene_type:complete
MAWKYYRNGKLIKECNDIPETIEDAVIELEENDIDVSDCVVDDSWSPDYPPEENDLTFLPLSDEEMEQYNKAIGLLKERLLKPSDEFTNNLNKRIAKETKLPLSTRIHVWWQGVSKEDRKFLLVYIMTGYLLIGVARYEPRILEILLWPLLVIK